MHLLLLGVSMKTITKDMGSSVATVGTVVVFATSGRLSISSPVGVTIDLLTPLESGLLRSCPWWVRVPTILLLTNSSMALTSSAALGVSELDGRTERREDVCTRERDRRRVRRSGE